MSPPSQPPSAAVARYSSEPPDDEEWFKQEVQPHETNLKAFLRHQFPRLRDVDDIVQDSYVKLFTAKAAGTLSSVRGFLFTSVRNAACDVFRRRKSHGEIPIVETDVERVVLDERNAIEQAIFNQELELAIEAIESLPLRCRQVMKLRKIYGLSYREIAEKLGIAEPTVSNQLVKGLRLCAEYLAARGVTVASHENRRD